jgi:hypothetical protein
VVEHEALSLNPSTEKKKKKRKTRLKSQVRWYTPVIPVLRRPHEARGVEDQTSCILRSCFKTAMTNKQKTQTEKTGSEYPQTCFEL